MAGGRSDGCKQVVLNYLLGDPAYVYPRPAVLWVLASTEAWTSTISSQEFLAEVDPATGYAHIEVANDGTLFDLATTDLPIRKANLVELAFPDAVAEYSIASLYLSDPDGFLLYGADLADPPFLVSVGPGPVIPAGAWVISEQDQGA